jgi:hypothetical protein
MAIIGLAGQIGSGKDAFCEFFIQESKIDWENKKFAGKLKEIVSLLTGCKRQDLESDDFKNSFLPNEWNIIQDDLETKKYTYREVLQKLGTDLLRNGIHPQIHINALFSDYNQDNREYSHSLDYPNWLITDLRFKNEFQAIHDRGGFNIKIIRYMSQTEWLDSKYFNQINFKNKQLLLEESPFKVISKDEFIEKINESKKDFLISENDVNFIKLIHQSETDLESYYKDNLFDYELHNLSDLQSFKNKIKKNVNEIESRI